MNSVIQLLEKIPNNTLIDTAQIYVKGNAEEILGEASQSVLAKDPSKRFYWATKFAPQLQFQFDGRDANAVVTKCKESFYVPTAKLNGDFSFLKYKKRKYVSICKNWVYCNLHYAI